MASWLLRLTAPELTYSSSYSPTSYSVSQLLAIRVTEFQIEITADILSSIPGPCFPLITKLITEPRDVASYFILLFSYTRVSSAHICCGRCESMGTQLSRNSQFWRENSENDQALG